MRWLENPRLPTWNWKIRWLEIFEMLNWGNVHCYLWLRLVGSSKKRSPACHTENHGNALCCTCKKHQKAWKNKKIELQDIHFKTPGSSISKHCFRAFSRKMMNHWIINPVGFDVLDFWIFGVFPPFLSDESTDPKNLQKPPRLSISAKQRRSRDNVSWDQFWWSTDYVFLAREKKRVENCRKDDTSLYDSRNSIWFFGWLLFFPVENPPVPELLFIFAT